MKARAGYSFASATDENCKVISASLESDWGLLVVSLVDAIVAVGLTERADLSIAWGTLGGTGGPVVFCLLGVWIVGTGSREYFWSRLDEVEDDSIIEDTEMFS